MKYLPGDTKNIKYIGFANLYKDNGELAGRVIIMEGLLVPHNNFHNEIRSFFSTKTGKELYSYDTYIHWSEEKEHPNGFTYTESFEDDMGNKYYIGKTEKIITIDF